MASQQVNSSLVDVVKVTDLPNLQLLIGNFFAHCQSNGVLGKSDLNTLATFLAPYISSIGDTAFKGEATTSGTPVPGSVPGFYIADRGSYPNYGNVTVSGDAGFIIFSGSAYSVVNIEVDLANRSIDQIKLSFLTTVAIPGKNLFNKAEAIPNSYIEPSNGSQFSGTGFYSTPFIEVKPNVTYHKNTIHSGAFYDANKNFLSSIALNALNINGGANAKYVRYSIANGDINIAQMERGTIETSYEAFKTMVDPNTISNWSIEPEKQLGLVKITESLSEMAPDFFVKYKKQTEDVALVLIGDSISTTNYYTTPRLDAKNRPPLMVEQAYVTEIEEQLRWDGQKYYRYDAGVFVETSSTAVTKEYDLAWDWMGNGEPQANYNNRPALTRILDGTNVSVKWAVPAGVKRCDFIFRTDYLNAPNARINVFGGASHLKVYDEATSSWIEAHNYVYSAKEVDTILPGGLRKSIYQKRLKIQVVAGYTGVVEIINQGSGRLTYWGIQTGIRNYMFDFILSARGGHSIARLQNYEAWDVDLYKPSLILWEAPIINQGLDVANPSYVPNNMGNRNDEVFANEIINKANQLLAKSYNPELITWVMWFGTGNNAIDPNNNWVYGYTDDGSNVSVPSYISRTVSKFAEQDLNMLNMFNLYYDYCKKRGRYSKESILEIFTGSGMEGKTITIDGGHFNTFGAALTTSMFDGFFLK